MIPGFPKLLIYIIRRLLITLKSSNYNRDDRYISAVPDHLHFHYYYYYLLLVVLL